MTDEEKKELEIESYRVAYEFKRGNIKEVEFIGIGSINENEWREIVSSPLFYLDEFYYREKKQRRKEAMFLCWDYDSPHKEPKWYEVKDGRPAKYSDGTESTYHDHYELLPETIKDIKE